MAKTPIPLSIKTRLGLDNNGDLEKLIPVFNDYPLKELIIHPRTGSQLYDGTVDIDKFEECLKISRHAIVYNGDIISVDDFKRLSERFPNVNNWMIGRGIVRNPHLLKELRDGSASSTKSYDDIRAFLIDLLEACKDHPRPIKVLGRMKEIWRYLGAGLDGGGALSEKVIRCESIDEYRRIIERQFFIAAPIKHILYLYI
jgi:tRNA-dihydrouridine synthase